jgi:hypothetical protein
MSTLNAHFGIGQATAITKVIVRWPSGLVDTIYNITPNTTLNVVEGSFLNTKEVYAAEEMFSVYPNPAHDIIQFKNKSDFIPEQAKIYEMSGRIILQIKVERNQISVKDLKPGNYLLQVIDQKGNNYSQKITIK